MKTKIITLAFILLIGTYSYATEVFLNGGISLSSEANITSFNSRAAKPQPAIDTDIFFHIDVNNIFKFGLSSGFRYAFNSNLNGGWSYPGFSGIEAGLDIRSSKMLMDVFEIGTGAELGWYRYNLTENFFFLPSIYLYPAFRVYEDEFVDLWIESPFKFYFHKQADLFLSAGMKMRLVFK